MSAGRGVRQRRPTEATVEPRLTLADYLREKCGLTGTHLGCEHGACGACTVLVDGQAVRSCLMFAVQADGSEVTTVEGIASEDGELSPVQAAMRECHGLQCGFCTPGFVMSITALLRDNPQAHRRGDPRGPVRQLLPVHRLSGHRQRGAPRSRNELMRTFLAGGRPRTSSWRTSRRPLTANARRHTGRPGMVDAMKIGFIGLGNMGAGMAANLLEAGHEVTAYNRSQDKVAALAEQGAKPRAAVAEACGGDIVITMLANDDAVEAVTFGDDGILASLAARRHPRLVEHDQRRARRSG